jgi:hypothetical protein
MSKPNIEDLRFSSSSIDDFWAERPKARVASGRLRISGVGDLGGFSFVAEDTLVRLSQQDFWKLGQDENGHFIERLVDDAEGPVKG